MKNASKAKPAVPHSIQLDYCATANREKTVSRNSINLFSRENVLEVKCNVHTMKEVLLT